MKTFLFDTHTDSIYIRNMSRERLSAHSVSDVPQFRGRIAGTWHKGPRVWTESQAHHISTVPCECGGLLTSLNVPQSTAKEKESWVTFSTRSPNWQMKLECRFKNKINHLKSTGFCVWMAYESLCALNYKRFKNGARWQHVRIKMQFFFVKVIKALR